MAVIIHSTPPSKHTHTHSPLRPTSIRPLISYIRVLPPPLSFSFGEKFVPSFHSFFFLSWMYHIRENNFELSVYYDP